LRKAACTIQFNSRTRQLYPKEIRSTGRFCGGVCFSSRSSLEATPANSPHPLPAVKPRTRGSFAQREVLAIRIVRSFWRSLLRSEMVGAASKTGILWPVRAPRVTPAIDLRRFLQLFTLALIWSALPPSAPADASNTASAPQLFVVTTDSNSVTVIDSATHQIVTKIPVGRFVYVANYTASMVNVIDTSTYQVSNIATPPGPRRLAITPGGDRVFATDYLGDSVSVIDTATQTLIQNIPVGSNPRGIAVIPDGHEIYVTNVSDGTVSVIDN